MNRSGMRRATYMLIAPECYAPGCHHDGDQYTMIKCRECHRWYCPEHVDQQEAVRLITLAHPAPQSLSYYLGLCFACRGALRERQPTQSAWLL